LPLAFDIQSTLLQGHATHIAECGAAAEKLLQNLRNDTCPVGFGLIAKLVIVRQPGIDGEPGSTVTEPVLSGQHCY